MSRKTGVTISGLSRPEGCLCFLDSFAAGRIYKAAPALEWDRKDRVHVEEESKYALGEWCGINTVPWRDFDVDAVFSIRKEVVRLDPRTAVRAGINRSIPAENDSYYVAYVSEQGLNGPHGRAGQPPRHRRFVPGLSMYFLGIAGLVGTSRHFQVLRSSYAPPKLCRDLFQVRICRGDLRAWTETAPDGLYLEERRRGLAANGRWSIRVGISARAFGVEVAMRPPSRRYLSDGNRIKLTERQEAVRWPPAKTRRTRPTAPAAGCGMHVAGNA
jgi:heat shock protein HspQ